VREVYVTAAVKAALGKGSVSFAMAEFAGDRPASNRLDVTCSAKARKSSARVQGLGALHRAGQTILTWTECDFLIRDEITFKEWRERRGEADSPLQHRYRIYRSEKPFSAETIGRAELVDEVGPLTGWNPDFYGVSPRDDAKVPR